MSLSSSSLWIFPFRPWPQIWIIQTPLEIRHLAILHINKHFWLWGLLEVKSLIPLGKTCSLFDLNKRSTFETRSSSWFSAWLSLYSHCKYKQRWRISQPRLHPSKCFRIHPVELWASSSIYQWPLALMTSLCSTWTLHAICHAYFAQFYWWFLWSEQRKDLKS